MKGHNECSIEISTALFGFNLLGTCKVLVFAPLYNDLTVCTGSAPYNVHLKLLVRLEYHCHLLGDYNKDSVGFYCNYY